MTVCIIIEVRTIILFLLLLCEVLTTITGCIDDKIVLVFS